MLKCKIKRDRIIRVKAKGTAQDLMVETAAVIHNIYTNIKKIDQNAADGYKNHLIGLLLDPNSPVWKEDKP